MRVERAFMPEEAQAEGGQYRNLRNRSVENRPVAGRVEFKFPLQGSVNHGISASLQPNHRKAP